MCGRYTLSHSTEGLLERFQAQGIVSPMETRYNIAPSQVVAVITAAPDSPTQGLASGSSARQLQFFKWGLIPYWTKDLRKQKPMINARAETLIERATFKDSFMRKRCLIPADGFYEWKMHSSLRIPMRIRLTGERLFAFAGIWDEFATPDGEVIKTCAVITVPVNETLKSIHNRMPAILSPEAEALWLDPNAQQEELLALLQPYPYDDMEAYPVSPMVNSPLVESHNCVKEVSLPLVETGSLKEFKKPHSKTATSTQSNSSVLVEAASQLKLDLFNQT
jgi:putative SOS response-associated peptidase YedK